MYRGHKHEKWAKRKGGFTVETELADLYIVRISYSSTRLSRLQARLANVAGARPRQALEVGQWPSLSAGR